MRKLLFLLLCTVSMYGQAEFDAGIQITGGQTNTSTSNKLLSQEANGVVNYIPALSLPLSTANISALQKKADLSTGLIKNGLITINADPTKYDISAGIGIISNFDDPENPISTLISFPAFTAITPTYLLTGNITYIAINSSSVIVMQASPFTSIQRRDLIILGAVIHSNLTNINVVNNISAPTNADTNQLHDFMEAIGALNITGNKYTANGANMQLNKSAGTIFKFGVNFANDWKSPHQLSQTSGTALTFRYRTQNGTEGSDRINLDPSLYDLNNVYTSVPNNKFVIETIVTFQTGLTRILKSQNYYDDLASAKAAIFTRQFIVEPNSLENGIIRGYVIMRNTTTSLQNVADAEILEAQKFGGVASGGVALTFANIVAALGYTPANIVSPTFTGILTAPEVLVSNATANTLAYFDPFKQVSTLPTSSYPSLVEIAYVKGVTSGIQTQLNAKAPLASPTFTGVPTAPTATAGTNTTQIATTAFVTDADAGNVKLTGNQTILGNKTLTGQTSVNNASGGDGIIITVPSTGSGLRVNSLTGSTTKTIQTSRNGVETSFFDYLGNITAPSFIKTGGTSSQFLKADGSSDGTAYVAGTGTTNYIPKWTGTGTQGNSIAQDDGTSISVGSIPASPTLFNINGSSTGFFTGFNINNSSNSKRWNFTTVGSGQGSRSGNLEINNNIADILAITQTGNVLIGTTTDDGIYKAQINGSLSVNGVIKLKNYTVATLPAGTQGDTAYVTDATAPTYLGALTGGGSVVCPVLYNGTIWVSH